MNLKPGKTFPVQTLAVEFQEWASVQRDRLEAALQLALPGPEISPQRLHQAMRYAVLGGGKRARALLCFAAGEITQSSPEIVTQAAASVELIHAYSLVHDDLPCMDNDALRRGKPACHIEFDEATALLVGDALQALAFGLLTGDKMVGCERRMEMITTLAHAAGSRGMAGGQALDLMSVGKTLSVPELEWMHIHKTGALIHASVMLGAYCGTQLDDKAQDGLDHFGKAIGLAFQVVDDVLDVESSTATLGKTARKDVNDNKPTYVSAVGLEQAKEMIKELYDRALTGLEPLNGAARRLREIADFIVHREF